MPAMGFCRKALNLKKPASATRPCAGVWTVLTTTAFGDVFPNVLGGFLAAGFGMVAGSLAPTRGNREYLAWWHEKNRDNVVNEPLMPKPAVVPISSPA